MLVFSPSNVGGSEPNSLAFLNSKIPTDTQQSELYSDKGRPLYFLLFYEVSSLFEMANSTGFFCKTTSPHYDSQTDNYTSNYMPTETTMHNKHIFKE